jgi:hypothetical protein
MTTRAHNPLVRSDMARLSAVFCALTLLASAPSSTAQQAKEAGQGSNDDVVVVTAQQTEEAIRDFVGQIAVAGRSQDQLSRWDRKICPGMVGLRASYAQLAIDQIARRAFDIGLDVGDPGCRVNILIIVSMDPDAVARGLFDSYRRTLGYYYTPGWKTLGRSALKAFVESKAPVRWWHVNSTLTADGRKADDKGAPVFGLGAEIPSVNLGAGGASLIKRSTRQDFAMAFVIVDGRRLQGMDLTAVADYLAMASLAQLDPDADTSGYPSILNLFRPRPDGSSAPASMTDWDMAYLRGLYEATRESAGAKRQQGEIARSMNKDLSSPD